MDALSCELQDFLIRLGKDPGSVSHKVSHYMEHLLRLLKPDEEEVIKQYYGLFGHTATPPESIAAERGTSPEELQTVIAACLRRIAVTPEWQMIRQVI